jgi:DNA-binding CsgD family transcriptional regulator/tetratricopeptide (TPR) repeat protein
MAQLFVGRRFDIEEVLAATADPTIDVVLITGPPGVGKTALLDRCCNLLKTSVVRTAGLTPMSGVPLGALAHLISHDEAALAAQTLLLAPLISALSARLEPGCVLAVDDLHACDDLSIGVAAHLAATGNRTLLASARLDQGPHGAFASMLSAARTRVIRLGSFDQGQSDALVGSRLDGDVDDAVLAEVWRRAEGNALFITALLDAAILSGALRQELGTWVFAGPLAAPEHLHELLSGRVLAAGVQARHAGELLAAVQAVSLEIVEKAGLSVGMEQLEEAGIAEVGTVETATIARFVHPMYGEALRATMPETRRRRWLSRFVDIAELRADGSGSDAVRLAVLRMEAGMPASPDVLVHAARLARSGGDEHLAVRLGTAAMAAGPRTDAAMVVASAYYEMGMMAKAVQVARRALAVSEPGVDALGLALTLYEIELWGLGDERSAARMLYAEADRYPAGTPLIAEVFRVAEAHGLAFSGQPEQALKILDSLEFLDQAFPAIKALAGGARSVSLAQRADVTQAVEVSRSAHRDQIDSGYQTVASPPAQHLVTLSYALREYGSLVEATEVAKRAYAEALAARSYVTRAWAALNAANAYLYRGALAEAANWAARSSVPARAAQLADCYRLALTIQCVTSAQSGGDVAAVHSRLLSAPTGIGFLAAETAIGLAWVAWSGGASASAVAMLRAAQQRTRDDGIRSSEMYLIHERVRLGDTAGAWSRLVELDNGTPLAAARILFAQGCEQGDPDVLKSASEAFERLDAMLCGAEAAALASRHASGRQRGMLAMEVQRLLERCGTVVTPALAESAGADMLTVRERTIAEFAAKGASSAEIAGQLHLSIRTVDNHLQRVYWKLGIRSRRELVTALR